MVIDSRMQEIPLRTFRANIVGIPAVMDGR